MCFSISKSGLRKSRFLNLCCQILRWFISIVIMLFFHCLFGAQPLCYLIYLWDLGACHFVRGFLWGPKYSHVSDFVILRCLYFNILVISRCLNFNILVILIGFLGLLHCIWIMLIYLKRWEPSYVFFNHYWAAMNPAKGQIWLVLAFCLNNEKTLHRCISMKFGSNTYTLFLN